MTKNTNRDMEPNNSETLPDANNSEHRGAIDKAKQLAGSAKAKFEDAGGLSALKEKGQETVRLAKELANNGADKARQKFEDAGGLDELKNKGKNLVKKVKGDTSSGQTTKSSTCDFLSFRTMITPRLIQILFWISFIICIIIGWNVIGDARSVSRHRGQTYIKWNEAQVWMGLAWVFIGPLVARIYCEFIILFFQINETLTEIKNLQNQSSEPT